MKYKLMHGLYSSIFKPLAFQIDAEVIHNSITHLGEFMENYPGIIESLFNYKNKKLIKKVAGINFDNPIGLSAGFDYDGHLAGVLKHVGFGFNTVGTVTALAYAGNKGVRLARLPESRSLLVNKGFKSEGAEAVAKRLDSKNLTDHVIGISIGSSNLAKINTINKAIDDYLFTFEVFKNKPYVKYFELNISCPNISMKETFTNPKNFKKLLAAINKLNIKKPIFVKMPSELPSKKSEYKKSDELVSIALKEKINGFIFSNLIKDRNNPAFVKNEISKFKDFKGNFSGRPCFAGSNKLISHTREKFGKDIVIIGTGGIFTVDDVIAKLISGADLVQLITGMIYEGPQLIGELNLALAKRL